MEDLLRWLAEWRGIEVEPGTRLHVELAGFPSGGLGLLVVLGAIGALALVWMTYRRDARRLGRGRRVVLTALRALAVAIAILLLLDPQIVAVRRDVQPGQTLVLVDTSQSMAQVDAFREPGVQQLAAAWREIGVADPSAVSRLDLARALLEHDDQRILARLREDNRVLVYGFSSGVEAVGALDVRAPIAAGEDPAARPPADRLDLSPLRAEGPYTNIGGGVRAALGQSAGAAIAGVVLVSDGRRNLGAQGPEVARLLRNRGIPQVVVLPVGDPAPTRTLRVLRLDAPEKVFQDDPFTISTTIEGRGYESAEFEVRLLRAREDGGEPVEVAVQRTRIDAGTPETDVVFEGLEATEAGAFTYSIEVEPPDLEPKVEARHVRRARVEALAERTRVLLIAGGPSHEYRILRNLLIRDDTIEVACWLSSADPGFPQDGDVSLDELPATREAIGSWDVFVLVDPDPERLDPAFCELVAQQVVENGAGLWWVSGEKFTLSALRPTASTEPLADLLPVVPDIAAADGVIGLARGMPREWSYRLTPQGRSHPVTRIAEDRTASEDLWTRVRGFHFAFPVERAKPGAQVLVEHRKPASIDDEPDASPLIATQFVGAGRVLFSATDDSYRWRGVSETAYDRLWVRGIRFLFEGRLNAGNSRLRIAVDEERIELGQAVKVIAEVQNETFEPQLLPSYQLALREADGPPRPIELLPVEGAPGRYEAWVRPTATGWLRVEPLHAPEGPPVGASFEVVPAALEKEGPVDLAELGAIASAPGAVLVASPRGLDEALAKIPSRTRIETFRSARTLWDSWLTIGSLVAVLALEWWLRKRSNLL